MKTSTYVFAVLLAVAAVALYALGVDPVAAGVMIAPAAAAVDPEQLQKQLNQIGDQIRGFAETAQGEIKRTSQISAETKKSVDDLLMAQSEINVRLRDLEQRAVKASGTDRAVIASIGEQFTGAEGFDAWRVSPTAKFRAPVKAVITSGGSSAGDLIVPQRVPGIVPGYRQTLRFRDLLSWGRTTSNSVEFVRELTFTNNAAPVSENPASAKPESSVTFEDDSAAVATIAHYMHATRQVLADVPMLQSYINTLLMYGLKLKEESQLLKGSGTGLNIDGVYTQATAYSQPTGTWVKNETLADRLRLAILQSQLASPFPVDGIVLNPVDWCNIELTKDGEYNYLFTSPGGLRVPTLWGLPVVISQGLDANEFLVGPFQGGAQGWDREDVAIEVATQDQDDFVKNRVKIRCEERLALTVYKPGAFTRGDFDGVESES